jgi:hypothetical protein
LRSRGDSFAPGSYPMLGEVELRERNGQILPGLSSFIGAMA